MMLDGDILIIGGYGAVGQVMAYALANKFPGRVIAAGRSYQKARALAQESAERIRPYQLDLAVAHENPEILDGVVVVVMCLDIPDVQFVQACLQRGIHYVDITAEDAILQQIEALNGAAKSGGTTAVLSVGLSPGLTNLLARQAQAQLETLHHIDIHGFLGLGEAHGAAAARWTLQNLNANYTVCENGRPRQVSSFGEHKRAYFPDGLGYRRVYRFNLADQHVVVRTLDLISVSTWVTFDPILFTSLMAFMRQSGLSKLLRYRRVEDAIVKMSTAAQFGSEKFAVQVEARGEKDGRAMSQTYTITGEGQGRATALVAAQVVKQLLTSAFPSGVFHSEQLFEPLPFIHQLAADNIIYHESARPVEGLS
jgi:saccharopine dehydrogenase-like NADP-dependent oxidoreductase